MVEVVLWMAIFASINKTELLGFSREAYLSYALWAAFFARVSATWMYEFRMIDEIDSGRVNSVLIRPISFFNYYLGQFLGYKILTGGVSFLIPLVVSFMIPSHIHIDRLPLAIALLLYYLILVHTLSFSVASLAFFWNRVGSITVAKNLMMWILMGELFPLDLVPDPYKALFMSLPFRNGVFVPVGYLTGRLGFTDVMHGFVSTTIGIVFFALIGGIIYKRGRQVYTGQGA